MPKPATKGGHRFKGIREAKTQRLKPVPNATVKPKTIRKPAQTKPPKFVHPDNEPVQKAIRKQHAQSMKPPSNRNTRVTAPHPHTYKPNKPPRPELNTPSGYTGVGWDFDVRRLRAFGPDTHGSFQGVPGEGGMEGEEQEQPQ